MHNIFFTKLLYISFFLLILLIFSSCTNDRTNIIMAAASLEEILSIEYEQAENKNNFFISYGGSISIARRVENNPIVKFIHSEVQNLTEAVKETADAMIYCNSIHYVPDKEKLLSIFTTLSAMFLPFRADSFENEVEVEKIISVKISIKNNEVPIPNRK